MIDQQDQERELCFIIKKYVGENFVDNNRTIEEIVHSLYRSDSEVWKNYAKLEVNISQADFVSSTSQVSFFWKIAELDNPQDVIKICLSMVAEVVSIIDKYHLLGTYSYHQAVVLKGILLTDFARVVHGNKVLENSYFINYAAVKFYEKHWKPYDYYMTSRGGWQKQRYNKPDDLHFEIEPKDLPKNDKQSNYYGCIVFIVILVIIIIFSSCK